jgi:hypothetical protein
MPDGQGLLLVEHRAEIAHVKPSLQGSEIEPGRPNGDGARLAASFICVTRSNGLPTGQMILDIVGDLLADRRQLKHLVLDDGIVGLLGKLPIHHRLVA